MEGYLQKWVNYVFGWKRRYFILHTGVLHYCQDRGTSRKGVIHLNVANISLHPKNPRRLVIDSGCTILHLKAATPEEAREWVRELRAAKDSLSEEQTLKERSAMNSNKESDQVTDILGRLSSLQATMEEQIDLLEARCRDPLFTELVQTSKDFKVSPRQDTMGKAFCILAEEQSRAKQAVHQMETTGEAFRRSMDVETWAGFDKSRQYATDIPESVPFEHIIAEDSGEFQDAASHLTGSDMFYDAGDAGSVLVTQEDQSLPMPYRKMLPFLRNPNQKYNIWKVVKDSIGKELSKMAVPVYFNEPISFLQRFSEDMLYSDLLIAAAKCRDQWQRLALIGCFAVSGYSVTSYRVMKPFNPLLGETFELQRDGFKLISEQVSHHPPVSALHCDHSLFTFWGSTEVVTSFKGVYLLVHPKGEMHVRLKSTGEEFVWGKPYSSVHNIIFGKMYVDHHGDMTIRNCQTEDICRLTMKKRGWFDSDPNRVEGAVLDSGGTVRCVLEGKWSQELGVKEAQSGRELQGWTMRPFQEGFEYNYFFTDYTIQLNQAPELFPVPIARTDSRYRPDQRALENGDLQTAVAEKQRVEEKQRKARADLQARGELWSPQWFQPQGEDWVYSGGYWEDQAAGAFRPLPDIF